MVVIQQEEQNLTDHQTAHLLIPRQFLELFQLLGLFLEHYIFFPIFLHNQLFLGNLMLSQNYQLQTKQLMCPVMNKKYIYLRFLYIN